MINFSVSRLSSMSKPTGMRVCVRKQKNEALKINMNTRTHKCSLISHSHKMALLSVGFYYLYWKSDARAWGGGGGDLKRDEQGER